MKMQFVITETARFYTPNGYCKFVPVGYRLVGPGEPLIGGLDFLAYSRGSAMQPDPIAIDIVSAGYISGTPVGEDHYIFIRPLSYQP